MRHAVRSALLALCLFSAPAYANQPDNAQQPPVFREVLDCRAIVDASARLACFDRSAAALATAAEKKDVLVVDRATARETKRGLFGLTLPKIKLFGDNDDEEIAQIDTTIASTYMARDGATVFVLQDGARWKQTDGRDTYAKAGQAITIRKGALGSYFAKVNNQPGVRVVRLQQQ